MEREQACTTQQKPNILIVEDEAIVAMDVKQRVESSGYCAVGPVDNAQDALDLAEQVPCSLGLLDIRIRGEADGIELSQQLQEKFGVPSVFITAHSDDELISRAKRAEPLGFLVKPISDRELRSTIEIALFRHQTLQERMRHEQEKSRIQKRLVELEKMELVGRLAAGVAHELNNALTGVIGNLELIRLEEGVHGEARSAVNFALKGCDRCSVFVKQLLGLSRQGMYSPAICDLRELVNDSIDFVSASLPDNIQIRVDDSSPPLFTRCDPSQLEQVLLNIILNARDAMPSGGVIGVSFDMEEGCFAPGESSRWAVIHIRDEGVGISSEHREKIFDAFWTTKSKGDGLGLGLSVVKGIMERHGGRVEVSSKHGQGTVFSLYFPFSSESSLPPS